ncbi:hypothetical protein LPJGGPFB_05645 [Ensifer adhaerens]|uniref:hypothetical protein n=1 Tax=Ensifer adhaerens TaxID=106592 RepID=UPI001569845C|nr:hypothetical protein [Ensifer adhaerens]NRP22386.1 hypothetical protein [Ensifer adhaerens]
MARTRFIGRQKVLDAFNRIDKNIVPEVAKVQVEAAEMVAERIASVAPRQFGDYANSIHAVKLADITAEQRAASFTASQTTDPNATGVIGDFIWKFLEYGTRSHAIGKGSVLKTGKQSGGQHPGIAPQPHVRPVFRASRKDIRRMMGKALRNALKKV